jgi:hypothetical protein
MSGAGGALVGMGLLDDPGVTREHVRIVRALRRMPTINAAFREGRLSYSNVREVTRAVDTWTKKRWCEMAFTATAAQLAKMIAGFRTASGLRIAQQAKRAASWHIREDGMIDSSARLPKEEAAVLIAAIATAIDQFGTPPAAQSDKMSTSTDSTADALLDVARGVLDTAPKDRLGECVQALFRIKPPDQDQQAA